MMTKTNLKKLALLTALLGCSTAQASVPTKILTPVKHVYSPKGFDSNDQVEVIVSGYLPNLCHNSPQTNVEVEGNKINITVSSLKYSLSNPFCPQVLVPFVEAVKVGVLKEGNYRVNVNEKSLYEQKAHINVAKATTKSVDDFMYANVEYVDKNKEEKTVTLKGYNPSDCFVLDGVKFISNGKDTYSVLPKLKQVAQFCATLETPFSYTVKVPSELNRDQVLLHVRSMNGKSVNALFNQK